MASHRRSVLVIYTIIRGLMLMLMLMLIHTVLDRVPQVSPEDEPFDYIVVASKNVLGHGPHMSEIIAPAISPGITTVVLIQNGINIETPYFKRFPQNIVLSGVSYAGSQEVEHGVVSHGNHDDLFIGAFCNPNIEDSREEVAAKHFVSLYAASGKASCQFTSDAQWYRWKKLVYNCSMNPLAAITDLDTGSLRLAGSSMVNTIENAMSEIIAVASAAGYTLPEDLARELIDMDPVEDHFEPSMLQDVRKVRDCRYGAVRKNHLRENRATLLSMNTSWGSRCVKGNVLGYRCLPFPFCTRNVRLYSTEFCRGGKDVKYYTRTIAGPKIDFYYLCHSRFPWKDA